MALYNFSPEDAFAFADFVHAQKKVTRDELFFQECPYCHSPSREDKYTFSINLHTGQFHCFRASCGCSGNMIRLSRDFGFSLGTEVDEAYSPKRRFTHIKQPKKPLEPKSSTIEFLERRGIHEPIAQRYEITTGARDGDKYYPDAIAFPFYDENGILQFVKLRDPKFDPQKGGNKEWSLTGGKPILFGMKQCTEDHSRLVVTEGQMDSLSVAEAGINNAVSVPNGARGMTWVSYCYSWVNSFDKIVIFGDYENSHISLLDDFQRRWPGKIMHVQEADYHGCKDANDILRKYGKEAVREAVENAVDMPVDYVVQMSDVEPLNPADIPKLRTGLHDLDDLLYGGLPFGEVCVITGKRGDGKSTLVNQIAINAVDQGLSVMIYSGEVSNGITRSNFDIQAAGPKHISKIGDDKEPRIVLLNGVKEKLESWYRNMVYMYDDKKLADENIDLIRLIERTILQYGVEVVVVDNLMSAMYINNTYLEDELVQQGFFVNELTKLAVKYNCLILLVSHPRKTSNGDTNDDVSGSANITNLAGIVLGYNRPTEKDVKNGMNPSGRKLVVSKNRLYGRINTKGIFLNYDNDSRRIYGLGDDINRDYGWNHIPDSKQDVLPDLNDLPEIDFDWE